MSKLSELQKQLEIIERQIADTAAELPDQIEKEIYQFFEMLENKYGIIRRQLEIQYYVSEAKAEDSDYEEILTAFH